MILFIVTACVDKKIRIPEGVLPQKQMAGIISDIQVLESVHKDIGLYGLEKKAMSDTSYAIVFNHYNVAASEFDSSLRFYTKHPKLIEAIMEEAVIILNQKN